VPSWLHDPDYSRDRGRRNGSRAVLPGTNPEPPDVRFGSKADMTGRICDVRFTPESGHSAATKPLGHDGASRACSKPGGQSESVKRDNFFLPQLVGGEPAHDRQNIALLDEPAHLAAESGGERTWTTADARRATASCALGLALVRALPASHAVCLRRRRHPVGAECLQ
jgi:hypothetical protein